MDIVKNIYFYIYYCVTTKKNQLNNSIDHRLTFCRVQSINHQQKKPTKVAHMCTHTKTHKNIPTFKQMGVDARGALYMIYINEVRIIYVYVCVQNGLMFLLCVKCYVYVWCMWMYDMFDSDFIFFYCSTYIQNTLTHKRYSGKVKYVNFLLSHTYTHCT